jgi:hypothetical protein
MLLLCLDKIVNCQDGKRISACPSVCHGAWLWNSQLPEWSSVDTSETPLVGLYLLNYGEKLSGIVVGFFVAQDQLFLLVQVVWQSLCLYACLSISVLLFLLFCPPVFFLHVCWCNCLCICLTMKRVCLVYTFGFVGVNV